MKELLKLIQERHSARYSYDAERRIPKDHLKQITEAARWTPTAHNMQNFELIIVDDKKLLKAIGKIKRPVSEAFVRENYKLLSFSEEELRRKKVGILGTSFPKAWLKPDYRASEDPDAESMTFGNIIPLSSALLIVLYDPRKRAPASEGDFLGHISLGCMMENMWLMANSVDISCHIVSSLSAYEAEKEIKKLLNIPAYLKIAFSLRLGYIKSKPKLIRVRRDIEDFTHHNTFDKKGID